MADDDAAIRTVLSQALSRAGYGVRATGTASTLWSWVKAGDGDLVITDVVMPDENAFDLLPRIKKLRPELPIIVMSAQNTFMTAIKASERGAYDYLPKPFDLRELVSIVGRAMAEPKSRVKAPLPDDLDAMPLVGRSPAMQEIYRTLARLMADGFDGDDHRRIRHGQGARGARSPRLRSSARRARSSPSTWRRSRATSSRASCSATRSGAFTGANAALGRPLRAGRGGHAVPRRDRRHADGGADAPAARAAAGRIHHRRRPHRPSRRNVRIVAATNKDLRIVDRAGPVPRRPVLPPQRGAAAPAAVARARSKTSPDLDAALLQAQPAQRGPAGTSIMEGGGARADEEIPLARQHPRT